MNAQIGYDGRNKESDIAESEEVPSITIEVPEVIQNTPAENHEEDTKTEDDVCWDG